MSSAAWWRCPNTPPCRHPGVLHDIEDLEDTHPRCCADGCDCGQTKPAPETTAALTPLGIARGEDR